MIFIKINGFLNEIGLIWAHKGPYLTVGKVSLKILIRDVDLLLLVLDIMRLWALHGFQHSEIRI